VAQLVIDASVARASGGGHATAEEAKATRDFLSGALEASHQVVLTPEISEEWRRHRSAFARRWLVSMFARRRVLRLPSATDAALRTKVSDAAENQAGRDAMEKDMLLIEAGLATERRVTSLDDRCRGHFARVSTSVGEIRSIVWVNPRNTRELPLRWLSAGAPDEPPRRLENWNG
jgi:hypothetical protein